MAEPNRSVPIGRSARSCTKGGQEGRDAGWITKSHSVSDRGDRVLTQRLRAGRNLNLDPSSSLAPPSFPFLSPHPIFPTPLLTSSLPSFPSLPPPPSFPLFPPSDHLGQRLFKIPPAETKASRGYRPLGNRLWRYPRPPLPSTSLPFLLPFTSSSSFNF
jgi:hypothetical protein